jgi:glutamate-1-semialdehyde 2,1-aminomutase
MIKELEKGKVYPHIDQLSEKIKSGVADFASKLKIGFQAIGLGSMSQFHFTDKPIKNRRDLFPLDKRIFEFHQRLLGKGIWMHMVHPFYTCAVHTDEDVEKLLTASEECLRKIK